MDRGRKFTKRTFKETDFLKCQNLLKRLDFSNFFEFSEVVKNLRYLDPSIQISSKH